MVLLSPFLSVLTFSLFAHAHSVCYIPLHTVTPPQAADFDPIVYPKPDGVLSFDLLR